MSDNSVLEEIRSMVREALDTELDRVLSWKEIARMCNYSIGHIRAYSDEMNPVMRGGLRIGARKRHVIAWLEQNEKRTLGGKPVRKKPAAKK